MGSRDGIILHKTFNVFWIKKDHICVCILPTPPSNNFAFHNSWRQLDSDKKKSIFCSYVFHSGNWHCLRNSESSPLSGQSRYVSKESNLVIVFSIDDMATWRGTHPRGNKFIHFLYFCEIAATQFIRDVSNKKISCGGRHSSVVSSAPTILQPRVQISSTPSMLFAIWIIEIEVGIRKGRK